MKVSKIGLKPIMRDDFEYEVLTALHFDEDHKVSVIKDNTQVFEEGVLLSDDYGRELLGFLDKGVDIAALRKEKADKLITDIDKLVAKNKANREVEALMSKVELQAKRKYGLMTWKELPVATLESVKTMIEEEVANA